MKNLNKNAALIACFLGGLYFNSTYGSSPPLPHDDASLEEGFKNRALKIFSRLFAHKTFALSFEFWENKIRYTDDVYTKIKNATIKTVDGPLYDNSSVVDALTTVNSNGVATVQLDREAWNRLTRNEWPDLLIVHEVFRMFRLSDEAYAKLPSLPEIDGCTPFLEKRVNQSLDILNTNPFLVAGLGGGLSTVFFYAGGFSTTLASGMAPLGAASTIPFAIIFGSAPFSLSSHIYDEYKTNKETVQELGPLLQLSIDFELGGGIAFDELLAELRNRLPNENFSDEEVMELVAMDVRNDFYCGYSLDYQKYQDITERYESALKGN